MRPLRVIIMPRAICSQALRVKYARDLILRIGAGDTQHDHTACIFVSFESEVADTVPVHLGNY